MAEERSRDRSSSAESQPKFPGCSHFRRRNDNHFRCQQCRLNEGQSLCTQDSPCLACKDWLPEAWVAQTKANAQRNRCKAVARLQRRRKQPRKLKRPWTIPWRYTLRKRRFNFLPSVPRPRDRPRRSGWRPRPRLLKNPLSPSPWRPASQWWDGPALTGRTVAGPGVPSASDGMGTTSVRIHRDISGHGVMAPGERASGPVQVPLAVPAPGGVPSPAVSPRRRTPVRRPLLLDIIIILRAIINPCHQVNLGRLPTAGLRPVTREDERVLTGRVRRTSPDGMSSCPPSIPSRLRRERSRWSLRQPGRFMLNRPQKFQSRPRWRTAPWRTARQVQTRQQATARTQVAAWQHTTARPQVTVRIQVTAQPQGTGRSQWTTQPVRIQQMSQKLSQSYTLMNWMRQTAQYAFQQKLDLEPR